MAGNVWEWCNSVLTPYPFRTFDDHETLEKTTSRIVRGGSFGTNWVGVCCATRIVEDTMSGNHKSLGFRVVISPLQQM
jgi:formylglycine-generating enzyme required for sulfatase activity